MIREDDNLLVQRVERLAKENRRMRAVISDVRATLKHLLKMESERPAGFVCSENSLAIIAGDLEEDLAEFAKETT